MEDLQSLIRQTREGNLRAFGYVVRRFHDMAVGYAFSILNDFHLAEDVAQEAFVQAFSRLNQLADPAAFPGWFRRIVFTRCDRILRKKSVNTVPIDSAFREGDSLDSPTIQMEKKELSNSVHLAIAELKEAERAVTTLFYITGYSLTEVANFLEIPESTVKSRLFTARRKLKDIITSKFDELLPETSPTHTYQGAQHMFKTMFPELHVSDVEKAATFFSEALGFKRGFTYEEEGNLDFVVMSHGDKTIYLHHMLPDVESEQPRRMRLYFQPYDIDRLHTELKSKGFQVSQLEDESYGARTFTLKGPDQYEFWFQQWTSN